MSRRDTIIISVLVNAALLAVLFITAVTSKNAAPQQQKMAAVLEETTINAKELFSANIENKEPLAAANTLQEAQKEFVSLIEETQSDIKKEEEKIVYKLPEVAPAQITEQIIKPDVKTPVINLENSIKIVVKKGDTLDKIAKANKIKTSEIIKANNLAGSFLKIGQQLILPKQNLHHNEEKQDTKPKVKTGKGEEQFAVKGRQEYYTVKVGDNPYTIAVKHNLKLADILKLNELDEKKARKLKPGDKIRIR